MIALSKQQINRIVWAALAVAMCISAAWMMHAGRDLTFFGDDIFYYARLIDDNGIVAPGSGIEYFLAPHNGHLQVLGKLIYRGLFETVGTDYTLFRAVEVASLLVSVGLFFVLARRRIGPVAALIPSVSLLFLGYAAETFLWAFDMHTVIALALGLAALLALERGDRRGDIAACASLVLAVSSIELGLAFVVGAAVAVLLGPDRWRRAWIFLIPLVLFFLWWVWAQQFGQSNFELENIRLIPATLTNALAAIAGCVFGLNPTGEGVVANLTTVTAWGTVLAAAAAIGLALRIRKGNVPNGLWVALAVVITYWLMIAMGGRPPDSSRYIFVGTLMVYLVGANALQGIRLKPPVLIGAACVVALAIPANVDKLYDWRAPEVVASENTLTENAMMELARGRVAPGFHPGADPLVSEVGGGLFVPLSAADYFRAAEEFGEVASSLEEVRADRPEQRRIADGTLVAAFGVGLSPAEASADPDGRCSASSDGVPGASVYFPLPDDGVLLGSRSGQPVAVELSRFGSGLPGVPLGQLGAGEWASLEVPADAAPDPWRVWVDGPVYVCPAPSGAAG